MSLDVYLEMPVVDEWTTDEAREIAQSVFDYEVRDLLVEIRMQSRERPKVFKEAVLVKARAAGLIGPRTDCVYEANITHNLGAMAAEAGIYECLWRPDEIDITHARDLITPLRRGVELMRADPPRFQKHNAPNGWGLYEHFVPFVEKYLAACEEYPDALVRVSV